MSLLQGTRTYFDAQWIYLKYLNRNVHVVNLEDLHQVRFDTSDVYSKYWFYPRYLHRIHEESVTRTLWEIAKLQSPVFFDIGANVGFYSCIMAPICKQVHAFEMHDKFVAIIDKNVRLNALDKVTVNHVAVSNEMGVLSYTKGFFGHAGLSILDTSGISQKVKSITLDSYQFNLDSTDHLIIKIDVEGAELMTLLGCEKILTDHDNVTMIIEVHPKLLNKAGHSPSEILRLLSDQGFQIYAARDLRAKSSFGSISESFDLHPDIDTAWIATRSENVLTYLDDLVITTSKT